MNVLNYYIEYMAIFEVWFIYYHVRHYPKEWPQLNKVDQILYNSFMLFTKIIVILNKTCNMYKQDTNI